MTVFRIGLREGIVCSESNGADSTGILLVKLLRSCMLEEEMKIIIVVMGMEREMKLSGGV